MTAFGDAADETGDSGGDESQDDDDCKLCLEVRAWRHSERWLFLLQELKPLSLASPSRDPTLAGRTTFLAKLCGLRAGWRGFAMDQTLLEGDILVFHRKPKKRVQKLGLIEDQSGSRFDDSNAEVPEA